MPGLWADGWFYISSAGLLVSGVLFFFLLGQYRAAADAADDAQVEDPAETPHVETVQPVYIPDELAAKPASLPTAPAPTPAPAPVAEPAQAQEKKEALPAGSTATGGISPAVVYLQSLKNQLEEMGGELRSLSTKVAAVTERDEALIERLTELTRVVEGLKAGAAPAEAAAPKRARKAAEPKPAAEPAAEAAPEAAPKPAEPAPVPGPEPEQPKRKPSAVELRAAATLEIKTPAKPIPDPAPAAEAPAELKIELGAAPGTGAPVAASEPTPAPSPDATMRMEDLKAALEQSQQPGEAPPEDKPRRGPVWPV